MEHGRRSQRARAAQLAGPPRRALSENQMRPPSWPASKPFTRIPATHAWWEPWKRSFSCSERFPGNGQRQAAAGGGGMGRDIVRGRRAGSHRRRDPGAPYRGEKQRLPRLRRVRSAAAPGL